ncbi:MAG TPA: urea ABC transporter substrate-binding protein [Chloroflexota bacterium]|nr:urea ABC transporter substrate-binding protein [Chloroflexota bacterium]
MPSPNDPSPNPGGVSPPDLSRRRFLRFAGGAAALSALGGILAACGGAAAPAASSAASSAAPASSAAAVASVAAKPSVAAAASAAASPAASAAAAGGIKVGVLNSLSGTMAISEVAVKNASLMAIDEINKAGGVMGQQLVPVVQDGASDWPTFAEKTKLLLQNEKVAAIFGCWTSASRKAVLPVVEQLNGLLYYPVQYEGLEASKNIFYIAAPPNQQIIPAVTYLMEKGMKNMYLLGSDYVFPRTANKVIKAQLKAEGGTTVAEEYTPLGSTDYSAVVSKIKASKPQVVFNTLNGDSNVAFFKQMKAAGFTADNMPVMSVSVAEEEVAGIGVDNFKNQLTAWNYFQSLPGDANTKFVANFKKAYGSNKVTDDPIEHAYAAVYLWAKQVEKAGSIDVDKVRAAADGVSFDAPQGTVTLDGATQHIFQKAMIGQAGDDGQFKVVWDSGDKPLQPDPYLKTYPWGSTVTGS